MDIFYGYSGRIVYIRCHVTVCAIQETNVPKGTFAKRTGIEKVLAIALLYIKWKKSEHRLGTSDIAVIIIIFVVIYVIVSFLLALDHWIFVPFSANYRLLCVKIPGDQHVLRYSNHPLWHQQSFHGQRSHFFPILMIDMNINSSS